MKIALLFCLLSLSSLGGQPQPKNVKLGWDPYTYPAGGSNAVIVVYKSTSLGTIFTPFKPTAYWPASRTNGTVSVLPGLYRFFITATVQPFGESDPSNTVTNQVNP
jgi:hypothetical protein